MEDPFDPTTYTPKDFIIVMGGAFFIYAPIIALLAWLAS
jgi:hypothetical protein